MLEELALPLPQSTAAAPATAELALDTLVQIHATTLFRVAHSLLRNRAEAEDTVQDTFLRVLQHRSQLPSVRDVRPWLIRITWNLALDRRRRTQPDQADDLFLQTLTGRDRPADQALQEAQQTRSVLHAMDRLPKLERQALLLSALEELDTADIARVMNKSESAVRALLHRARIHLRERLRGLSIDRQEQKGAKR